MGKAAEGDNATKASTASAHFSIFIECLLKEKNL